MYKFVTAKEYAAKYKDAHPHAVKSPDESEYVISTIDGDVTHDEAMAHINNNWGVEE